MTELTRLYRDSEGRLVAETRFRVRFYETDQMGVVHHAAYITWFEVGRSAFTRAIGYPYSEMEADGLSLAVAEVYARYHRPARYDDEVLVVTCLTDFPSRGMSFAYEVRRAADHAVLVTGSSKHISIDHQGRVVRIGDVMRGRIMGAAQEQLGAR